MVTGWVMEGFPRTRAQVDFMNQAGIIPDKFIVLQVDEKFISDRISGRRIDPVTNQVYHVTNNVPKRNAQRLVPDKRSQDVKALREMYEKSLGEIVGMFNNVLVNLDASQSIEKASEEFSLVVESLPEMQKRPDV
jgi:adenylate kinase